MEEPVIDLRTPGEKIIAFCNELIVPEGALVGQKVRLRSWQELIIREIYDNPVGTRRAIISMGRKNGKSALIAMLVLVHLIGPKARRNAQIYSAAQSRDQASIVFGLAAKMVRMSVELNEEIVVRDTAKELFCTMTGVRYKALSADATTAYGLSPALVISDELGQVRGPKSELYDALETAMGAQEAPLSLVISTQAPTDSDLLSILIDDARMGHDPRTKLFLFEAGPEDPPYQESTWRLANPALGDFRSLQDMQEAAERAQRLPAFESAFRNLFLNQRVAAESHFLTRDVWALNAGEPDMSVFSERPVFAGLDLSSRQDLTALVLIAQDEQGITHVDPHFFTPTDGLKQRADRDRAPYDLWAEQGYLIATPGRTVDYSWVAHHLVQLASKCDLRSVRFDRWRIGDLQRELEKIGASLPLEEFGQGYKDQSPGLENLEALAVNGKLRHGNHPVLTWMASNSVVARDPAGNRKLDKSKTSAKIDGMVALVMAVGLVGSPDNRLKPSIYETRDLEFV